jgi:hypothetical protein
MAVGNAALPVRFAGAKVTSTSEEAEITGAMGLRPGFLRRKGVQAPGLRLAVGAWRTRIRSEDRPGQCLVWPGFGWSLGESFSSSVGRLRLRGGGLWRGIRGLGGGFLHGAGVGVGGVLFEEAGEGGAGVFEIAAEGLRGGLRGWDLGWLCRGLRVV